LFDSLKSAFGHLPFLAEDLGVVTENIHQLRARLGFPGMRILLFAFDDPRGSDYLPHRFVPDTVVYSGTHDNDTLVGWLLADEPKNKRLAKQHREVRSRALKYVGTACCEVHWAFIRVALQSVANTAIFPMQDILGLGSEGRMNTPATVENNWVWRLTPGQLRDSEAIRLRDLCERYERISPLK
jgi:4-alpha-glucanotransferase